jgi:hypothetical protein
MVPCTSFFTALPGVRVTLLEKDETQFEETIHAVAKKVVEYVDSSK